MPTTLVTKANEESTFIITASFTDEDGNAVVPNSGLTWTLTDRDGDIINSRSAVSITPASSVDIVLTGDDLAIQANGDLRRVLALEGTYNSDAGNNLPIKDQVTFEIYNLVAVS